MITMKTKLKIIIGGLALSYILAGGCNITAYAQEGATDKLTGKISNQQSISDKVNTTEQPDISDKIEQPEYLKELSDAMNDTFQNYKDNLCEIGGEQARKETINGQVRYFVKGLDCPLRKLEFGDNIPHNLTAGINYGISQGFKDIESIFYYTPEEINTLKNTIETEGEKTFIYVKLKGAEDTKSSAQDKKE